MNNLERKVVSYGLLGVTFLCLLLWLVRATFWPSMSFVYVMSPFSLPLMVAWGLLIGAGWDRLLRGRNVHLGKGVDEHGGPYRSRPWLNPDAPKVGDPIKRGVASLAIFAMLYGASGCATGYRATYGAGAITKEFVSQSHAVYSEELNGRIDKCAPTLPPDGTEDERLDALNECLGKGYTRDDAVKVAKALAVYVAAAEVLSAALLQAEPGKEELDEAWGDVLQAALDALAMFPEADAKVQKLKALLGRMGR